MKYWLILGMAAVTYLPRLIPLIIITERPLPEFWKHFLFCIPYTALGALIIPGVYHIGYSGGSVGSWVWARPLFALGFRKG